MAHRVGARVADMEYVQFHPTTFYHPQSFSFLISEAVRGAGARLVDAQGIPFMAKYEPAWQDLAPRDVVARSVYQEMTTRQVSNVYLDLASYIPKQTILQHFPAIYQYCLQYGVDLTRDLVPVVPAAHYACGGVETDHWGRTGLAHLYAVGEVAHTGVHGANRLASTSLLEGLVWGYRAARHIQYQLSQRPTLLINHQNSVIADRYNEVRPVFAERPWIDHQLNRIKQLMWAHVGLIRTTTGLRYAARELRGHKAEIETIYQQHFPDHELVGLRNMAQTALLVTTAALKNKHSLGCHYRLVENQPRRMPYQPVAIS
jgi:L-aspartate oxidase